jgi:hypothetical protein
VGLMQIMPCNYSWLGITDPTDPAQNLEGGCRYLGRLVRYYHGNEYKALWAYNGGTWKVRHNIMPAESRHYIRRVTAGEAKMGGMIGGEMGARLRVGSMRKPMRDIHAGETSPGDSSGLLPGPASRPLRPSDV